MIYTVTFNPAVDVLISVTEFELGGINRASSQKIYYGGKGVNVSHVLRSLGRESTALGFLAGSIGRAMNENLVKQGMACQFVMLPEGETRVNTKLRLMSAEGALTETAFNAPGPHIDEDSLDALFDQLRNTSNGDVVILSGGVPDGVSKYVYADILKTLEDAGGRPENGQKGAPPFDSSPSKRSSRARQHMMSQRGAPPFDRSPENLAGTRVVVDATGELLLNAIPYHPFLIKPNDEELAEIIGCDPDDHEKLVEGARDLHAQGALNVLVSRGGKGAFLVDERGDYREMGALPGKLVNSVGAGDSTVAGFVHGYLEGLENGWDTQRTCERAFALAMACGAATAFSEGLASRETIEECLLKE